MEVISTLAEWEAWRAQSEHHALLIFKHSTRCPISSRAYAEVQRFVNNAPADFPPVVLVKVIESRLVSNTIAEALGIFHKSPQIILMSHGDAVWSTSHYNITEANLQSAIREVLS